MRFQIIPYVWILTAYYGLYTKKRKKRASPVRAPGGKGGFRESPPENLQKKTNCLCKEGGF